MGNIEKYGVVALLFVIVMVLAISIWGPRSPEKDLTMPDLAANQQELAAGGPLFDDSQVGRENQNLVVQELTPLIQESAYPVEINGEKEIADNKESKNAAAANYLEHVVKTGDRLENIALQYLGSRNKWTEIVKFNENLDPLRLRVGQKLLIPKQKEVISSVAETALTNQANAHVVQKADTLYGLAEKYYGKGHQWKKIYDANREAINNPNVLPVGKKITIP